MVVVYRNGGFYISCVMVVVYRNGGFYIIGVNISSYYGIYRERAQSLF